MGSNLVAMDRAAIVKAAAIVRRGGLVVYPTDTVYGLGCDPFDPRAVRRLFEAKRRSAKPVPVLCSSTRKAESLVEFSPKARQLAKEHWPGALTIVAPLRKSVPPDLTQGSSTLGVRVPASEDCRRLITLCGGWITGTSANLSGRQSAKTALEASRQIGERVDLILDGGTLNGEASTVVRVVQDTVTILRTGPVGVGKEGK